MALVQIITYSLGTLLILIAVYFMLILMVRKSVWNYPPVLSFHIFWAFFFLFFGIVIIKQIKITGTIVILMFIVIIIWSYVTQLLPARKEMNKSSISDIDEKERRR